MVVCSVSCVLGSHQGAVGFVAIKSCSRPPHALDATPAISEPSCCHMPCSTAQQAPPQAPGRRRAASSSPLGSPWRRPLTAGRASLWALVARVRGKVYVNAVSLRAPLSLPFSIDAPHCWPAGGAAVHTYTQRPGAVRSGAGRRRVRVHGPPGSRAELCAGPINLGPRASCSSKLARPCPPPAVPPMPRLVARARRRPFLM